ncbi:MAG: glycosyltransferase family 8 protein [Lachnospiraceae bacterium]|nr:glycosyltransferase family 8 protein [Lachnospiraceae bacterium]
MFYYTNQLVKTGTVMNILTAVNETYLEPLSVMLYSLAVHHPLPLNVFILHLGIAKEKQNEFQRKIGKWRCLIQVQFILCHRDELKKDITYNRYGMEAVLRLTLLKTLPKTIDRILWLDADIIVKGNIQYLYRHADNGQYALVCEDMFPKWEKCKLVSQLGMKTTDRYFNSGVMVFYLNNMRKDFDENTFFHWMDENRDKLKYPDQNTLNVCLKGKLSWAKPEIYNLQLLRIGYFMDKSNVIRKSKILHYNTKEKPWDDNYHGEGEFEFWKYGVHGLGIKKCIGHYMKKIKSSIFG